MSKRKNDEKYEKLRRKLQKIQEQLDTEDAWQSSDDADGQDDSEKDKNPNDTEKSEDSEDDGTGTHSNDKKDELSDVQNQQETVEQKLDEESELDDEILELLGEEKPDKTNEEFKFHSKLANNWQKIIVGGLPREEKMEILNQYPRKGNCQLNTPVINPEVESFINDTTKKRDKFLALDQDLCSVSLSALGSAIGMIFEEKKGIDKAALIAALWDSGKMFAELFHQLIRARKAFIYPSLDKQAKALLEKAQTDEFLFSSELSLRVKTAKSVATVGSLLEPQSAEKKAPARPASSLNWRAPSGRHPGRSQTGYRARAHQRGHWKASSGRTQITPQVSPAVPTNPQGNQNPHK